MSNRGLQSPGLPASQERWLTLAGWLSLGTIAYFGFHRGLLGKIIAANAFFLVFIIMVAAALAILALYGVMNSWRRLRHGSGAGSADYIDLGWGGGLMGHYTDADEDDLCGIGGGGIDVDFGDD